MPARAVRFEPYRDGLLLEALETAPDERNKGYAKQLLSDGLAYLRKRGSMTVYSHIHKKNKASVSVHTACGFRPISNCAVFIDGSVSGEYLTYCANV